VPIGIVIKMFAKRLTDSCHFYGKINSISVCGGKYGQQKINVKLKGKTHFLEDCRASSRPFQEM
jgi:hypothetical protein